ncbi:TonB-dependent receptor [Paraferrimonas sp. SM1919]|uniref:TonB-dependent receptor n=1 Tax=Paraferrimonas sp. SM1919 TaxID=2662263 RepID=UPI0013D523DE|nr:TonB-dependent receptor [Paraferrimonas sp. SM1919]
MSHTNIFNKMFKLTALSSAIIASTAAYAEEAQQEKQKGLEVIEVTAQKRVQRLQDVGMSVDALSQDQLKDFGVNSASDIVNTMTNVELNSAGGNGNQIITIRGIGLNDFGLNNTPTAAVHVDEAYLGSNAMTSFAVFDLERAEVMKGPQGTLFGRNSTAGVINFITNKPTEDFEGYLTGTVGNYNTYNAEGAFGGEIANGVRARVSFKSENTQDGWQENLNPTAGWDNNGKVNKWAGRFQLAWEIGNTEFLAKVHGGADKSDAWLPQAEGMYAADGSYCPSGLVGRPDKNNCYLYLGSPSSNEDLSQGMYDYKPYSNDEFVGGSLRIDHDFGFANFTSLTAAEKFNYRHGTDLDGVAGNDMSWLWGLYGVDVDSSWQNASLLHQIEDFEIKQISQEFRLTSPGGERFNWLVGVNYAQEELTNSTHYDSDAFSLIFAMDFLDGALATEDPAIIADTYALVEMAGLTQTGNSYYHDFEQSNKAFGVFGQADYSLIADTLKLNFGARYTTETKDFANASYGAMYQGTEWAYPLVIMSADPNFVETTPYQQSIDFNHLSWNVGLDYNVHSDLMFYATVSNGFKAGGFPAALPFSPADSEPFGKEVVDAFEVGTKGTLLDNTLQYTAAAFYYDYQDMQGVYPKYVEGQLSFDKLARIGDVTIKGVEFDAAYQLFEGLTLRAAVGLIDTEIKDSATDVANSYNELTSFNGNELSHSPKVNANSHIRYEFDVSEDFYMALQADVSYKSEYYLRFDNEPSAKWDQASTKVGARIMFADIYDKWNVALWGRNLTNEMAPTYQSFSLDKGDHFVFYNMPRTFGIDFNYKFGM